MDILDLFVSISETSKRTDKERLLREADSPFLREILDYTYNPYKHYHVVKVSKKLLKEESIPVDKFCEKSWKEFLQILESLDKREHTGHAAVKLVEDHLKSTTPANRKWMVRVLQRHLNVGITSSTINKVFDNIIPTFKVQLAQTFEDKRVKSVEKVATEPKLDGVRCIAIVKNGNAILHSRNGKVIGDNYLETIVADLERLVREGYIPKNVVFDGELMGSDFTATVSQIHKKNKKADVSTHFYHIFDWMHYEDWISKDPSFNCLETREKLEDMCLDSKGNYLRVVKRDVVPVDQIKKQHDIYVSEGYEGVMIKLLDSKYKFGRGHNVMKLKSFYDIDLEVVSFLEGEGKYENSLGSIVVKHKDVLINVGSGFSDEDRRHIWENRSQFRGMIAEIRYQEETPDGSLRFPTFRGWRPDKKKV